MTTYVATSIDVVADFDVGEGWLAIRWPDVMYGQEGLRIDLDGHCSRNMPIRSGDGPPDFVDLQRDHLIILFAPSLAKRLELDERIYIQFNLSDDDFRAVEQFVNYFDGESFA